MAVFKNEKTKLWEYFFRHNGKPYRGAKKSYKLKSIAEKAEKDKRKQVENETVNQDILFKDVYTSWLAFEKIRLAPSTYRSKHDRTNLHLDSFMDKKIKDITLSMIHAWQGKLKNAEYIAGQRKIVKSNKSTKPNKNFKPKHYGNDMLQRIQGDLKDVFSYAVNNNIIHSNLMSKTVVVQRNDPTTEKPMQLLTYEQFQQFISVVDDLVYFTLFSVAYWTGIRPGELKALNIEDFDTKRKILVVKKNYDSRNKYIKNTKTGDNRIVAIPVVLQDILEQYIIYLSKYNLTADTPLFSPTKRIADSTLRNRQNMYIKKSGLPHFTPNQLRHTHVSTMRKLGLSTFEIEQRTGHSEKIIRKVYSHLDEEQQQNIVNSLDLMVESKNKSK